MVRIITALLANLAALLVAKKFVAGFIVTNDIAGLAMLVVLFAVANSFILPILRFVLKPLIWLTAGLLAVVINGALIYAVDFYSASITINGLLPLLYTTIIFGIINGLFAYGAKAFKEE